KGLLPWLARTNGKSGGAAGAADTARVLEDLVARAQLETYRMTPQEIYRRMLYESWDALADDYTRQRENMTPFWQHLLIYSWLYAELPPADLDWMSESMLLEALGPLGIALDLAARGRTSPRHVTEIDLSPRMLTAAYAADEARRRPQPLRIAGDMRDKPVVREGDALRVRPGAFTVPAGRAGATVPLFRFAHNSSLHL